MAQPAKAATGIAGLAELCRAACQRSVPPVKGTWALIKRHRVLPIKARA